MKLRTKKQLSAFPIILPLLQIILDKLRSRQVRISSLIKFVIVGISMWEARRINEFFRRATSPNIRGQLTSCNSSKQRSMVSRAAAGRATIYRFHFTSSHHVSLDNAICRKQNPSRQSITLSRITLSECINSRALHGASSFAEFSPMSQNYMWRAYV